MGLLKSSPIKKDIQFHNKPKAIHTPSIKLLKDLFCFEDDHIYLLYKTYNKLDMNQKGYLQLDDFIKYFNDIDEDFAEMPYLQRLFNIIGKEKTNNIFFQEFVSGISVFCLMNSQSILQFVFDFIDLDGDQKVTKKDILKALHYRNPKNGNYTFFTNFSTEVENFKLKQRQIDIEFNYFRINSDKLMFLTWPAYRLQQRLRQKILGTDFWSSQYSKVQKKQYQIKNNQKKNQRMKQKISILKGLKMPKNDGPFIKDMIKIRLKGQSGQDSKLQPPLVRKRKTSVIYVKGQLSYEVPQTD